MLKKYKHILSNISYAIRNMRNWDCAYIVMNILRAPVSVLGSLCIPFLLSYLASLVEKQIPIEHALWVLLAFFAASLMFDSFSRLLESRTNMRKYTFSGLYQNLIVNKFLTTDYNNTDSPAINNLYMRAMDDACSGNCAPEFIVPALVTLGIDLLGIITYAAVLASVSPWVMAIMVLSSIILYVLEARETAYLDSRQEEKADIERRLSFFGRISADLSYGKEVRLFQMGAWLEDKLIATYERRLRWLRDIAKHENITALWIGLTGFFRDGAIYVTLALVLFQGNGDIAGLVLAISMVTGIASWMASIANDFNLVVQYGIRIGYYKEYLALPERRPHRKNPNAQIKTSCGSPEIVFHNVSYRYPGAKETDLTLQAINQRVLPGEKIALVGENGAGKTTLIKLLCGLYYPSSGEITVDGIPSVDFDADDYYSLFSVVFQDIHLLPVSIATFVSSKENPAEEERHRIQSVLEKVGLWEKVSSLPNRMDTRIMKGVFDDSIDLSGGENQKLLLARALYKDAPVVILDEPTASLDPLAEASLYRDFSLLTKNKTTFFISHRLASTRFCSRIWLIKDGHIVEAGTHEDLMGLHGLYSEMYDAQAQAYQEEQHVEP